MALTVDQKRLKATKFPPEFDKPVDIKKVNIDLIKKWIAGKITAILGDEDDVVVETCYNLIEQNQFPKIKELQIQLTGFLDKDCAAFCKELWDLMLSAQESPVGVPKEMLEAKKLELQQEQASKVAAETRRTQLREEEDMLDTFRRDEHSDRRHERFDRGRGRGRPFRGDRGPPRRYSRSPPPRQRGSPPPRRERDVYVPGDRGRGLDRYNRSRERRHSPSSIRLRSPVRRARRSLSSSRSRTPPKRQRRSPSSSLSRSPVRRSRRSPLLRARSRSPRHREGRNRDRSWSPRQDKRRLPRYRYRSVTPKEKSSSPSPRLSKSRSRSPLRRRRHVRSPSRSRSSTQSVSPPPARNRYRRNRRSYSSEAEVSNDMASDVKKRKRSSSSRTKSRSRSNRTRRRLSRSPTKSPPSQHSPNK